MSFGETFNIGGLVASVSNPTVTNVTSASGNEGTSLVHTVTLSAATTASANYTYSLGGGTATSGVDYTVPPIFSNGVTLSGSLTVPSGVSSFTVTVAALSDGSAEGSETYDLTIGGITGVGTINNVTPSGDITPDIQVNRTSGVAPLAVHFDASGTTSALTSFPYHEIEYTWDFDDVGAGNWLYGAKANFGIASSKETDRGPEAIHVFETPGNYVVTLNTRYDSTTGTPDTVTITVDDPDVVFSGANTIYIGNTLPVAGVGGVPSGATALYASSDADASIIAHVATGKRVLFNRGDTFTISADCAITANGPWHVGAYGTGARPIFDNTSGSDKNCIRLSSYSATGLSDGRICDLDIDAGGGVSSSTGVYFNGPIDNVLISRVKVSNAKYGMLSSVGNINPATGTIWDGQCYYECEVYDSAGSYPTDTGGNGMYPAAQRLAIVGCNVDPAGGGEHGIRSSYSNRAVFAHNSIQDVVATKAHLSIRAPMLFGDSLGILDQVDEGGIVYIEKIVAHDNYCAQTDGSLTSLGVGPVNQENGIGRVRNAIMELNYMLNGEITSMGSQVTTRNNILTTDGGTVFPVIPMARQLTQSDNWYYNNSIYYAGASNIQLVDVAGGPITVAGNGSFLYNNLVYAPSASSFYSDLIGSAGDVTITLTNSNNSTDTTMLTSPNFTTTPPTQPSHWKPTSGAYPTTSGTLVPVWSDWFGVTVTGATRCLGAVKN